jgi:hypothetical protein
MPKFDNVIVAPLSSSDGIDRLGVGTHPVEPCPQLARAALAHIA